MAETTTGTANYDPDDYFAQAVTDFTGYTLPARSTLFDKLSSSSSDGFANLKLFRMDIQGMSMRSVTAADYSAIGGWQVNKGEDYDLAFYDAGGDGAHNSVSMKKARIVMIGVTVDGNGRATLWSGGEVTGGGAFEGSYSHVQWDSGPMAQYISGSKLVLDHILASPYSTQGFEYSGLSVIDANAVDMLSFETTGQSFDRVVQFFKDHSDIVNKWMTSLGEDQAAWKGKAASLFWHLLNELKTNYDGYVSQLGGRDYTATNTTLGGTVPKSKLSDALAAAQLALKDAITNLQAAWTDWASDGQHDPHYHAKKILDEISQWVINNNINHVLTKSSTTSSQYGTSTSTTYSTDAGFKQSVPEYGDLTQHTTWQKVADAAVKSWSDHADSKLKQPSIDALSAVKNAWADVEDAFANEVTNKNNETLSEVLQKEENEIAEDEAKENNDKLNENLNNLGNNVNNLGDNLNNLNDNVNDNLNNLGDNLNNLNDGLNDNLNNIGDGLNNLGTNLNTNLNDSLNNIGDGLNSSLNNLNDDLGNSLNNVGSGLDDLNNLGNDSLLNNDGTNGNDPSNLANAALNTLGPSLLNSGNDSTKDGSTTLNSPTGGTTQLNGDGSLTTTFPDGSTQTIDPSTGLVTTTNPDGTTSVSQLNPGSTITNPDGSTTTLNDDGTLTTKFPDGTSQTLNPDTGQVTTTNPDGTVSTSTLNPTDGSFTTPDGSTAQLNSDGTLTTKFPDGSTETLNPDTGQVTVTDPSGHVTTSHLNPGDSFTNPDGSTTTLNDNGTLTTKFPDGSTQTLNPDTGQLTTTDPSGHTTTTDIDGTDLPSSSIDTSGLNGNGIDTSGIDTSGLNNGSSLDTSGLNTSGLNSGGLSSGSLNTTGGGLDSGLDGGYDDYDSTPYTGGALRSDALDTAALDASTPAQASSGTPLNPMGMGGMGGGGMGGMGGGGGGGQGGTSERTRAVLTDPSNGATRRGRTNRAANVDEDEDVVYTRPTTSSAPYPVGGPGGNGAGQNGRSTESGDRARDAWLTEDEDVWGTDEGGSPAVIGR
ncbi:AAWKG family protein [Streptomyces sp. NBC_01288]|uniref:AAWKG family protein n=1 Tax=Streptomyces sp. NBC_01288 TaxID=2903814 RepID=UPI002E117050|nr:AAWKG family protein [Streptomyces sp. NBC_01288]WSL06561.1 AAWKG family protein [Streptomyces sp. NBC_01288]